MASAYRVLTFDLATLRDHEQVTQTFNNRVATVTVLQLPAGAVASIHFGSGGEAIPLLNQGMEFTPCPPEDTGIFLTNPVGAGSLILLVTFGTGLEAGI